MPLMPHMTESEDFQDRSGTQGAYPCWYYPHFRRTNYLNSYRTPGDLPPELTLLTMFTAQLEFLSAGNLHNRALWSSALKAACRLEVSGCLLRATCRHDEAGVRRQSKQAPRGPFCLHFFQRRVRGLYGAAVHPLAQDQHNECAQ